MDVQVYGLRAARLAAVLTTADRVLLAYSAFLAAAAVVSGQDHPAHLVAALAALALGHLAVALAAAAPRSPRARVLHDFLPFPELVLLFAASGPVIAATNPLRFDSLLSAADLRLLGPIAPAWRQFLGRPTWLVDLASLAYMSYYVMPLAVGIGLYRAGRRREFSEATLAVVTTLVLSYAGYFLFPTTGPRVPPSEWASALGGGAISRAVRAFVAAGEVNVLDAFPSGHTALGLVSAWLGWRAWPRARPVLAAAACGIVFSTVYLSYHYVMDVVAGVALALAVPRLVPRLRGWFGPLPG